MELRIQHALNEGRGVFRHLAKRREVFVRESAISAGDRLLVEDLDGADDDVRLERNREHRVDLEADVQVFQTRGIRSLAIKK